MTEPEHAKLTWLSSPCHAKLEDDVPLSLRASFSLITSQRSHGHGRRAILSSGSDCDAVWFCPRRMKTPIVG
eukprot:scaffold7520_cov140-Skeletonema_marinoi.AAC.6